MPMLPVLSLPRSGGCRHLIRRRLASSSLSPEDRDQQIMNTMSKTWNIDFKGHTPFTTSPEFKSAAGRHAQPIFRILDLKGNVVEEAKEYEPKWTREFATRVMEHMTALTVMDNVCLSAQRQGRISFYMSSSVEEATQIGSTAALEDSDEVFAQYREFGALLWRGYTVDAMIEQCMGSQDDPGKGRQMPVHYGSPTHHFQTVSSPLATQLPHAAGMGYARRLSGDGRIVICYFGDGAASEGDFHAGLNFAATLKSQTLFFCRNNGWAISTPTHDQYAGDGIYQRGIAYGIPSIRVDGNDVLAVYYATLTARQIILETGGPVLVEAMTFRGGHHSTSDDATRYRNKEETELWRSQLAPIPRFAAYLINKGWWSEEQNDAVKQRVRKEVLDAIEKHEHMPKPSPTLLFDDVLDTLPRCLERQREHLFDHLSRHPMAPGH